MIYFIEAGGYTKIGYSKDPEKRLRELQTGNPVKMVLAKVIEAGIELESVLHTIFRFYRCEGEWFTLPVGYSRFLESISEVYELIMVKNKGTCYRDRKIDSAIEYLDGFDAYTKITDSRIGRAADLSVSMVSRNKSIRHKREIKKLNRDRWIMTEEKTKKFLEFMEVEDGEKVASIVKRLKINHRTYYEFKGKKG